MNKGRVPLLEPDLNCCLYQGDGDVHFSAFLLTAILTDFLSGGLNNKNRSWACMTLGVYALLSIWLKF